MQCEAFCKNWLPSLWILFFPNDGTNFSFSSPTYNVFNFRTFEATSIKFNLLYGVLLITSNFIKHPRKARKFSTRLLCSEKGSFCLNVKINDLNNGNTDNKKIWVQQKSWLFTRFYKFYYDSPFALFAFLR